MEHREINQHGATATECRGPLNLHATADQIRAALLEQSYVHEHCGFAELAERDAQINAGRPVIRVTVFSADPHGREMTALVQSGLVTDDGAFWPSIIGFARCPVLHFRKRDARKSGARNAEEIYAHLFTDLELPVEWVNDRRIQPR